MPPNWRCWSHSCCKRLSPTQLLGYKRSSGSASLYLHIFSQHILAHVKQQRRKNIDKDWDKCTSSGPHDARVDPENEGTSISLFWRQVVWLLKHNGFAKCLPLPELDILELDVKVDNETPFVFYEHKSSSRNVGCYIWN